MWDFDTEVSEVIPRTPTIRSFRFRTGATDISFIAGQFEYVVIKVGEGTEEHHFSISSSPTEPGYLEHTKRITQSAFSQSLARIKPGDWVHLRGPEGQFTLPESPRKLGFLSGGIGITGMRSMLRYIADRGLPANQWPSCFLKHALRARWYRVGRPDIIVVLVMAVLSLWGACQIINHAWNELRSARAGAVVPAE